MSLNIPQNLVFENPKLKIFFETKLVSNQTASEIVIIGIRNGFLSLANCLIYLINELSNSIALHELPFVSSSIKLTIKEDFKNISGKAGQVDRIESDNYVWLLTEDNAMLIATGIHSLGHQNPEFHIDADLKYEDISVYCVVDAE